VLPSGGLRGKRIGLVAIAVVAIWGFSGFFQVDPEELGVVLRFGQYVRDAKPGLRYHLPYPIEAALTPKVTRVNRIDIGLRGVDDPRRGSGSREVPEESLMLTGDENIIDVEFSVFWLIKPDAVGDYLFNIQQPEGTVKAVAESAMREVIGRSEITGASASAAQALDAPQGPGAAAPGSILTAGRATAETTVQEIMQKTLDSYHAGVQITQVQLQKVDPPAQVIDSFRDVQAALSDAERAQNEAQTYANQVIPNARGRAAQITQAANAYREQTVVEAIGQTARFLKIYEEYKKAPKVTRKRMYLETMERLFKGTDKIILDSRAGSGVVPYPPLTELTRPENLRPAAPPNPAQTPQTPGSR
jgi:membrane protease subunit HflK